MIPRASTVAWLLWTRLLVSRLLVALLLAGTTAIASAQEAPHRQGATQSEQQRSEQSRRPVICGNWARRRIGGWQRVSAVRHGQPLRSPRRITPALIRPTTALIERIAGSV
jgi:hypothetical protein